jgi:hypothetical protein
VEDSACRFLLLRIYDKIIVNIYCIEFYEDVNQTACGMGTMPPRNERNKLRRNWGRKLIRRKKTEIKKGEIRSSYQTLLYAVKLCVFVCVCVCYYKVWYHERYYPDHRIKQAPIDALTHHEPFKA